jgi:phosphoribosylaminoimidazole carboxylase (NCAIR synthetase)
MLSRQSKIERTQRLLRMLEQDAPLLAVRVAPLNPDHQRSAMHFAEQLMAHTQAELKNLLASDDACWDANDPTPQAAD